ncbi:MAG: hypothetical protein WD750_05935 [Gammaproteobacteria bacterium]
MYSFYTDIHEGARRLTIRVRRGWLYRLLTGQEETTVAEIYLPRKDCFALSNALHKLGDKRVA